MARFRPGWKITLFTVILLPTVIALGFWQLSRGAEKRAMEMDYLTQLTALPVPAAALDPAQRFQRIKLTGRFSEEMFLVDNQIHQGRTGYWIVQVFDNADGARYLVNRGFVAGAPTRDRLPEVAVPQGVVELIGTVWPFTGLIPVLDEDLWPENWPKRVQRLDVERMSAAVGAVPFEIRLEPGQPGVAQAAPFAQVLSDAKHLGYAATWFGLALALLAGFLVVGFADNRQT